MAFRKMVKKGLAVMGVKILELDARMDEIEERLGKADKPKKAKK